MWTWILFVAICVQYSIVKGQGEIEVISHAEPREEDIDHLTGPLSHETIKKLNTPIKIPEDLVEVEDLRPGDDKDDDGDGGGGQDGGVEDGGGADDGGGEDGGGADDGGGGGDSDGKSNQGINGKKKKKTKIHEDKEASDQSPEIGGGKGGLYQKDMLAGDIGDLAGANKHRYVPRIYADFARRRGRRSGNINRDDDLDKAAEEKLHQSIQIAQKEIDSWDDKLRPVKADPNLVMDVALQSARLAAATPANPSDAVVSANIMRSGNYWNSVWKEDVPKPSSLLRSHKKRLRKPSSKLESVRVKIMPGSKLYELVALTKQISPKLLYIINKK